MISVPLKFLLSKCLLLSSVHVSISFLSRSHHCFAALSLLSSNSWTDLIPQCVILATRPIFFPCLRAYYEACKKGHSNRPRPLSELVEGLSEACVNAARTSSSIIAQLRSNRDLATFGFFDALSIFSSTLILMMSSTIQYKSHEGDRGKVETSVKLLKTMRDDGNISAHNYYDQLMQLKDDLDHAVGNMDRNPTATYSGGHQSNGFQMRLAASGSDVGTEVQTAPKLLNEGHSFGAFGNYYDTGEVLNVPYVQRFVNSQQLYEQCPTDAIPSFLTDDLSGFFDLDFLDMNAIGMFGDFTSGHEFHSNDTTSLT